MNCDILEASRSLVIFHPALTNQKSSMDNFSAQQISLAASVAKTGKSTLMIAFSLNPGRFMQFPGMRRIVCFSP